MTAHEETWRARVRAAWQAFRGEPAAAAGDPRARAVALEMDLRDRDAEIARLRQEYERLQAEAERGRAGAAAAGFQALAKRLAPLLSQLATMQALAETGREVRAADVLKLFAKVEQVLADAGMTRIGAPGEETVFDTRQHQRMSGGDVDDGDPITVRFVGYRLGETMLAKAMVSRRGTSPAEAQD